MRLSKEQFEERLARVRQLVVRDRRITCKEISERTGFSLEHAWKLRAKVFQQITQNINEDVKSEVKVFAETIDQLCKVCWTMIENNDVREQLDKDGEVVGYLPKVSDADKLKAVQVLANNLGMVLDKKFDAGIFTKQLGEMQVKTFSVFVDLVKSTVDGQSTETRPAGSEPYDPALPTATQ